SICISSSAYDHVQGKVGVEFADLGEQNLKNIALPIRAYAVVGDGSSVPTQAERARSGPLSPPRLSIVVLPFANLSGDPEQEYFVDGVIREPNHGLVAHQWRVRDCAQHGVHVQGQSRRRKEAGS